jgi:iron complex outermembrane receptor protein
VFYRSSITGNRDITDIAESPRVVAGVRGEAAGWEVDASLLRSSSRVRQQVNGGFPANSLILPILNSGNVNFWGPSDPDVEAAIRATGFTGDAFRISSDLTSLGGKASRELLALSGGMLSVAVGGEFRREDFLFDPNPTIQTGDISGYGGNFLVTDRSRNVAAAFAEVVAPVARGLELGAAVRFDRYQGVGHASAPKLSVRWQPVSEVLLRASVGRGFRAPSLQDLYLPQTTNVTPQGATDPIRCPVTNSRNDCGTQFNVINGGNPDLKPERSRNVTLGLVVAPTNRVSFSMDYFNIDLKETIVNGITATTILGDLDAYGYLVARGPVDPAFPNLPGPITAINQTNLNLGRTKVQGLDFEAKAQQALGDWGRVGLSFSGSYFIQFDVQNLDGSYTGGVDVANAAIGGVVPRWKHNLSGDWSHGPWGVTLTQNFHKGYRDLPSTNDAPGTPVRRVGHYETLDAQLRYTGFKGLKLKFGIRNLRDQAPPYSNAGGSTNFQGGYDVSYTDPRGRLFYAGLSIELP